MYTGISWTFTLLSLSYQLSMAKLIRVDDSTYKELGEYGHWNDTMDSIIWRLLQEARSYEQKKEIVAK